MLTRAHSGTFLGKIGADFSSFRIRLAIIPQRSTRIIIRGLSNIVATLTTTSRPARFPPERSKRSSIWPQLLNRPNPNRSGSVLSRFHSSDLLSRERRRIVFLITDRFAAVQLQCWLGHGKSLECLCGGLHQWNANLLAAARGRYGWRRYCSRMPHGKDAVCIFMELPC